MEKGGRKREKQELKRRGKEGKKRTKETGDEDTERMRDIRGGDETRLR